MPQQPISIELLPTPDRASVVILLRSSQPIPMSALVETIQEFSQMLTDKFMTPKIEIAKSKIIFP